MTVFEISDRELLRLTLLFIGADAEVRLRALRELAALLRQAGRAVGVVFYDFPDAGVSGPTLAASFRENAELPESDLVVLGRELLVHADQVVHDVDLGRVPPTAREVLREATGVASAASVAWYEGDHLVGGLLLLLPAPGTLTSQARSNLDRLAGILRTVFCRLSRDRRVEEHEQRLRRGEEVARLGTWEFDISSGRSSWSDGVYPIFGVPAADGPMQGRDAFKFTHPDDDEMVRRLARRAQTEGIGYDVEHRIIRTDGEERWLHAKGEVTLDAEGRPARIIAVTHDITERRALEEASQRGQRLEALRRLMSGIAQDFNNLLTVIIGSADSVRSRSTAAIEELEPLMKAAEHAQSLVSRFLLFVRTEPGDVESVDVCKTLDDVQGLLSAVLPRRIDLQVDRPDTDVFVDADPVELRQVILNLVTNAEAAISERGTVEVALTAATNKTGEPRVRIEVRDTGRGIPADQLPLVFDPYYTTRRDGTGTGLGLAIVHRAISRMNGEIRVESVVGEGTTFFVDLPRSEPPTTTVAKAQTAADEGRELVLVVDDNPAVRQVIERGLSSRGYEVEGASGLEQALDRMRTAAKRPSLIFTDHQMTDGSGIDLALAIRGHVAVPVILCTGWADEQVRADAREAGIAAVIDKPVRPSEVAMAVRAVLDGLALPESPS